MRRVTMMNEIKVTHSFSSRLDGDSFAKLPEAHKKVMDFRRRLGRQCEVEDDHCAHLDWWRTRCIAAGLEW